MRDVLGASGGLEYVELAWLTATLATVGGALRAGNEGDDAVLATACTRAEP